MAPLGHGAQSQWKDPPYLPVGGGLTYARASCYVWEKFSERVQMYDGFCSVRCRLKTRNVTRKLRAIVVRRPHLGLRRHWRGPSYGKTSTMVNPALPAMRSGKRCKLPQRGPRQRPGRKSMNICDPGSVFDGIYFGYFCAD